MDRIKLGIIAEDFYSGTITEEEARTLLLDLLDVNRSFPVEQFRQKLLSMRSTREAINKLSEADRLMMYGYHDCINEMLMWAQPYRK